MFTKSKRRTRLSAIALSLALIATACGGGASEEPVAAAEPATEAPDAEVVEESGGPGLPQLIGNTVAGAQIDTNDLAGQDVAIWFWAPW